MNQDHSQKGGALAATLLIISFLLVFVLTLANLATFDLRSVGRQGQTQLALNAAEAGLELVASELARDPQIGNSNEVFARTFSDGSRYRVTFDDSGTSPWSVNNLDRLVGVVGPSARPVPPLHAYLVADGFSPTGTRARVETLIRLEAIPYAIAGTNRVRLNSVTVAGSNRAADAPTGANLAGHVYSGNSGSGSLGVNGLSRISGDARSAGGISVGALANVVGDVEPNLSPETLPVLRIEDFRNDTVTGVTTNPGGIVVAPVISGQWFFNSNTTLTGVTAMADATIYVQGDLTVAGSLLGNGTIFVNGETRFIQAVNLTGSDRLTLFSEGDISILLPSIFQGVMYTHGNVTTTPLLATIVFGAVYAVGDGDPSRGNVTLGAGSTVIHVSELTAFATSFLGRNGESNVVRVYWNRLE